MPAPKHSANTESFSAPNALSTYFAHTLHHLGPFEPWPHLAVALSGGADSTALLLLARAWAAAHGGKVTAVIVDHRLRETSTQEAHAVATRHDAIILTPDHATTSNNLSERAREWRYDALTDWCVQHDVLHLLIAHHADDQTETVALHTARGATEDGASGMAAVTTRNGVRILRPLLGVPKVALVDYLHAQNTPWVEDPTNRNLTFARNALRTQLTPQARDVLLRTAAQEGAARHARDRAFADALRDMVVTCTPQRLVLDYAALTTHPATMGMRILADGLRCMSGSHHRPRKHETERLYHHLQETDFTRATLKHCLVEKRGMQLHITPEPHKTAPQRWPKALAASPFWWLNPRLI